MLWRSNMIPIKSNPPCRALFSYPSYDPFGFLGSHLGIRIEIQLAEEIVGIPDSPPIGWLKHVAQQDHEDPLPSLELHEVWEVRVGIGRQNGLLSNPEEHDRAVAGRPFRRVDNHHRSALNALGLQGGHEEEWRKPWTTRGS